MNDDAWQKFFLLEKIEVSVIIKIFGIDVVHRNYYISMNKKSKGKEKL